MMTKRNLIILLAVLACAGIAIIVGGVGKYANHMMSQTSLGLMLSGANVPSSTLVSNLGNSDPDLVMTSLSMLADRRDSSGQAQAHQLLLSSNGHIWLNATLYLGAIGDQQAVPHLIRGLRHHAWRAHADIAAYLHQITGQNFGTNQNQWIAWWQAQNPGVAFDFNIAEYSQTAQHFQTGQTILITRVIEPTIIEHLGARIQLVGVMPKPGVNPAAATHALELAVKGQMVELECDSDPSLTPQGARRAFAYWVPDPINDPAMMRLHRQGLGPVPIQRRTLIQHYLIGTGLYDIAPDAVADPAMRAVIQSAGHVSATP